MNKLRVIGETILDRYGDRFFSLDQVARSTKVSRKYATDVLVVFSQEGLIKKVKKHRKKHIPGYSPRFSLIYRVVDKKALTNRIAPRLREKTAQDRMWFIIRKKRSFVLRDLIVLAGARRGTARWFLKMLRRMRIIEPSRTGGGLGVEWALIEDVGPKRPYINSKRKAKGAPLGDKGRLK